MKPVCVIAGLTATGKTSTAVALAKKWNAEIISADSVAVYKELNIGSAKPTLDQRQGVPHYMIDVYNLDEEFNVAVFQREGRQIIQEIQLRGKNVIIVGGTGLYIKALLYDYRFMTESNNKKERIESTEELYQELKKFDSKSAEAIHPNNRKRIIRALDSYEEHQKGKQDIHQEQKDKKLIESEVFFLAGERESIYHRINQRVETMFEEGLLEEVVNLNNKYDDLYQYQSVNSIGYKEFQQYFNKSIDIEEVNRLIKRNTRRFAKRQMTWFKHQQESIWIDIFNNEASEIIERWMKEHWGR